MNINQRINRNFQGCILVCLKSHALFNEVKAVSFFEGLKDYRFEPIQLIKASKRMRKELHLVGVGKILRDENTYIN